MTKAIIFDTDGMVVVTDMFSVKFCKEYNVPFESVLPFFKNEFQPCLIGRADLKAQIKPYLPKWGWKKSVDEFLEYWFRAENNTDKRVVNIIDKLKQSGIKCYLATNQEKYRTEYLKKQMEFEVVFDRVFSSAEMGCKKPQREFFEKIITSIGLNINEVQFWDDTEENIEGAKNFGLDAKLYWSFDEFSQVVSPLISKDP